MLQNIRSLQGGETNAGTALELGLDGFSMRCAGQWEYDITFPLHKRGSGNFTFAVNHTSLHMDLLFNGNPGFPWLRFVGLPSESGGCKVNVEVTELQVTGAGILSSLVHIFQTNIETVIKTKIDTVACQGGRSALATLSSILIPYQLRKQLSRRPAAVTIPGDPRSLLEWADVGILKAIPNASRMGHLANTIITDTLGCQQNGVCIVNASVSGVNLSLAQVGVLGLSAPHMSLNGLTTMESLVLMQPVQEKHSLRTALVQRTVEAQAAVRLELTPFPDLPGSEAI